MLSGAPITCAATTAPGTTAGTLVATCTASGLPVDVYDVTINVGGNYYRGSGETVVTVFDPSLGFVTGGGTLTHDGNRANFGVSFRYKRGDQPKGSLLYIEHRPSGDVVVKSNALSSMAISGSSAVVLGKATANGVGNQSFRLTLVDNGEPGTSDQLGLKVTTGKVVTAGLDFAPITLNGGNITVPH